ncbi:glycerol-3-phosphate acyltransferase 1, mitochondrial-like [Aplysia californica]|uniref:Glycerol-3-phosphate acyltransferase 1, mitochondrial-like n=1 Tax=Aplysia californica TaxID=6500 RepID=A0ABM0JDI1_APLCA|nr:glycerol-3-phosphate acyltransferase 1, mitochondrial-like [Aplysia californica]
MRSIGGGVAGMGSSKEPTQRKLFRRRTVKSNTENRFDIQTIGAFKLIPSYTPSHFTTNRPLMGQCCRCMPLSQRELKDTGLKELGMRNLFDVRNEIASSSILSQLFPLEAYTLQRPLFNTYPDISSVVLTSPRVVNAIQCTAEQMIRGVHCEEDVMSKQLLVIRKRCVKIINTMKASVSPVFISITAWFLTRFLARFVQSVQVCRGQMMMIRQSSEKEIPMIYLPLHRSHLDYILVTLILWHYDIRAPHVAAGDNMDIPFFNLLMRALGGFFIRRRLDSKKGEKDVLYRAILNEYMSFLLRKGENLEFFIEGGRTRTGRSVNPKGGLLSVVVDAFNEGEISDAYIVPVTFSYEKIIDGNYNREQMGIPKIKESFWGAMKAIFHVFFNNYGNVRVDFSQPFSLREFLQHSKDHPYNPLTAESSRKVPLNHRVSYPNFSQALMPTNGEESVRMSVKALADHVVYSNDRCTPPMSTHLTAFLLLTKYRHGAYMKELVQAVHWIVRELQGIRIDVGFCGRPEDAILHAQKLLGSDLISTAWHAENNDIKLVPNLLLPNVFELSYYGNLVSTHFALESVVATAVLYESGLSFYHLQSANTMEQVKVSRDKVLETAEEICNILHSEYIFVPPCGYISSVLMETLENMISKEVLYIEDSQGDEMMFEGKDRRWAERLAQSLDPDEDEDEGEYCSEQPLLLNMARSDVRERLHFLFSVIAPLLESYMLVGKFALDSLIQEQEEEVFVKALGEFARERVSDGLAVFSESCAMITLRSAVKALQDMDIIYSYRGANLTILGLSEEMDARPRLEHHVSLLQAALS